MSGNKPIVNRNDQLFMAQVEFRGPVVLSGPVVQESLQLFVPALTGKVGATVGWIVEGVDEGLALLPAAETDSTLIIPLPLHIGDTLNGVSIIGQIESAGAVATLDLDVRLATVDVNDFTDISLDTDASGDVTADEVVTVEVVGLDEPLTVGEMIYVVITGTTAALTDIAIAGLILTYDRG